MLRGGRKEAEARIRPSRRPGTWAAGSSPRRTSRRGWGGSAPLLEVRPPPKGRSIVRRSWRLLGAGLVVAALGVAAAIGGATAGASGTSGQGVDPALLQRLHNSARGSVSVHNESATQQASFVSAGQNGDLLPSNTSKSPDGKANDFVREYGALFGGEGIGTQLVRKGVTSDAQGGTHVSYTQVYQGVPVFGSMLRAHLDAQNDLTAVNGTLVPDLSLSTSPKLSASDAAARAIAQVAANPPADKTDSGAKLDASSLRAGTPTLVVYRMGLVRGTSGTNQLVYTVPVTGPNGLAEMVFVHAHAGKVVNRYSLGEGALVRVLYEQNAGTTPVWVEGDPFPGTLNEDQANIVDFSGDSYRFYMNTFGRD